MPETVIPRPFNPGGPVNTGGPVTMGDEDRGQEALRRARHNRQQLREKSRVAGRLIHDVGQVFGQPLRAALERPFEDVSEHGDEAAEAYEVALRGAEDATDRARMHLQAALEEQQRVREAAHRAQDELIRRHRKARRDLPEWLADDLCRTNHPNAEEPF